jgi:hypothetical protein
MPFDPNADPAAAALTTSGSPVLASREALAATLTPVSGKAAESMRRATRRAEERAARLVAETVQPDNCEAIVAAGLEAVAEAIARYRSGEVEDAGGGVADGGHGPVRAADSAGILPEHDIAGVVMHFDGPVAAEVSEWFPGQGAGRAGQARLVLPDGEDRRRPRRRSAGRACAACASGLR